MSAPDEAAIDHLYREEYHRLLRLAVMLLGDRGLAEDVVQEAFLALQRRWAFLAVESAAAGYLRVCVVNGARSVHRRQAIARRMLRSPEPAEEQGADAALILAEEHQSVVAAVRRLPRRQQQIVVLRYWTGMSEADIALALGISAGTVKSTAARARAALAITLGVSDEQ